jgi:hypothetical protein
MDSIFSELEPAGTGTSQRFRSTTGVFSLSLTTTTDASQEAAMRERAAQNQTMDLDSDFFDDYGKVLNLWSRNAFVCFMKYNSAAKPLLGADPSGILEATWERGEERLSIRFDERHRLSYAISYLDPQGVRRRKWDASSLATFFSDCPNAKRIALI